MTKVKTTIAYIILIIASFLSAFPLYYMTVSYTHLDVYKRQERIKPEKIGIYEDGSIRIDVGEEVAGSLCLTAEGSAGDTVEIFCGEELDESGSVRCEMRCNCSYHEIWTLSDGCCSLEPYDYKGFRYAKLLPGKGVNIRGIFVQTRHYPCLLYTSRCV